MSFEKEKADVKMADGAVDGTVKEVQSAGLAEAILKQKPNPWSKNMFTASCSL
jgi:hypothetical protein